MIWHKATTLFERIESDNFCQIRVFSQNEIDVDVNYWFPKETDSYDCKIKLSIKPLLTINEKSVSFPRILLRPKRLTLNHHNQQKELLRISCID